MCESNSRARGEVKQGDLARFARGPACGEVVAPCAPGEGTPRSVRPRNLWIEEPLTPPSPRKSGAREKKDLPLRDTVDLRDLFRAPRPVDRLDVLLDLLDAGGAGDDACDLRP